MSIVGGKVQIRQLKAKDFHALAGIMARIPAEKLTEIGGLTDGKAIDESKVGSSLAGTMLDIFFVSAAKETEAWFADLAGVTVAEYAELPLSAPMDVIEGIFNQEGFIPFLARSVKLAMVMLLSMKQRSGTTASPPATDGQTKI